MKATSISIAAMIIILSGCAAGPDFRPPEAPKADTYTAAPLPRETAASPVEGGEAQHFIAGGNIPDQWWSLFGSESLDKVIRLALSESPTLTAAEAALRQAQENLNAKIGSVIFPGADGSLSAKRQKISGVASGQSGVKSSTFNLYNASVRVSYLLDLFGAGRRELESLRSQVDYQDFQLEAAYLALTANIVTAVGKEAALRGQIRATNEIIGLQEKQLDTLEQQLALGGVSLSEVLAQKALLAQTRAALPALEKELSFTRHQLAVLAGKLPKEAGSLPEFDLKDLKLPRDLPVSLPSSLARQRPDIRASEELLHAASALVGVATANLYPQITLSGALGSESADSGNLFSSNTFIWNLGAGLVQPVFHGGELRAKRRAAVAAYDEAFAQYRQTVLLAFQNVADVLRALDDDARTLKAQSEAHAAALDSLTVARKQFELGGVSYFLLLDAERRHQEALISLIQAEAARFADTAALFQALGGGWWNRSKGEVSHD